jgi:gamma-glutamyl phosphate reductase
MADNDDNDPNAKQAKALIDALGPKVAEAILPALQKQVEEQLSGVLKKNEELLAKIAKDKSDDSLMKLLAAADQQQRERLNKDGTLDFRKAGDPVRVSKEDARDPAKYRAAKELAAKQGVPLEIVRG